VIDVVVMESGGRSTRPNSPSRGHLARPLWRFGIHAGPGQTVGTRTVRTACAIKAIDLGSIAVVERQTMDAFRRTTIRECPLWPGLRLVGEADL
jgi:hypothetical protein